MHILPDSAFFKGRVYTDKEIEDLRAKWKNNAQATRIIEDCIKQDSAVIWLICPTCRDNPSACDSRPFKATCAELASADGFILCEYCGARCIETDTPKGN